MINNVIDYTFTKFNNNTALREGDYLEQQIQNSPRYIVHHRQQRKKISRIQSVSPSLGEVFYLRALLSHRPARSFAELRHVNDVQYATFHEAAIQFGLFENTNEGFYALEEASLIQTPAQLRFLFARVVLEGFPAIPLWDHFRHHLSQDYIVNLRSEEDGVNEALLSIEKWFTDVGKSIVQYGLPQPVRRDHWTEVSAELRAFENRLHALREQFDDMQESMNEDQQRIFLFISHHFHLQLTRTVPHEHNNNDAPAPVFVEGKPGRGKTYLIDAICSLLRSRRKMVLICASSALAASIYERGRTAHSLFKIPVDDVSSHLFRIKFSKSKTHSA